MPRLSIYWTPMPASITFDSACADLETALTGPFRSEIVAALARSNDLGTSLSRMREHMRANFWKAGARQVDVDPLATAYDRRTRQDGFHALHDWDGLADEVNPETIPVDVLDYLVRERGADPPDEATLGILLDYYFVHLLSLVSMRLWDVGDPDANLDRVQHLLGLLQGVEGSGQQFSSDAETLILIATSHYERHEWGYDRLLAKVRTLSDAHRLRIARGHAASMGCHLRFGFEATYGRDTIKTRDDNVADYPWLCFALVTLGREYVRLREAGSGGPQHDVVVEALLNGLSPDSRAFVGDRPPSSLAAYEADLNEFRALFRQQRPWLLADFARLEPSDRAYSPLSFFFNFSHNVIKGIVVDALLRGAPWRLTLNDLLSGEARNEPPEESREFLARLLTAYARLHPSPIRGRLMPVIVYDPRTGRQAFAAAMQKLKA